MLPAVTNGPGMAMGTPDVCKTPAPPAPFAPIPYPNITNGPLMNPGTAATGTFVMGMFIATIMTQYTMSSGDEPGVMGGMVSQLFKGPCIHTMGSTCTFFGGKPAAYLTSMVGHNGAPVSNFPAGMTTVPSQTAILIRP